MRAEENDAPLPLRLLAWWLAAFVAQRAALLWWGFDGLFFWEEAYRLLIAEALADGWSIPMVDLQADPYSGGNLVVGALASPIVALLGPDVLILKLVALFWSAVGFAVWIHVVGTYFGARTASYFALCYICAPPLFAEYNLIAMGSHAETVTISALVVFCLMRWLDSGTRRTGLALAYGFLGGIGAWYSYTSLVTFTVCCAAVLLANRLDKRSVAAAIAGFAVGFAPWMATNFGSGFDGLNVLRATFGDDGGGGTGLFAYAGAKFLRLATQAFPDAMQFRTLPLPAVEGIPGTLFGAAYLALFAACWLICASGKLRPRATPLAGTRGFAIRPELLLLSLFPAFFLAILASNQSFYPIAGTWNDAPFLAYRVLVPAFPAMFFAIAYVTVRATPRPRGLLVAAICLFGLLGTGQVIAGGATERPATRAAARTIGAEAMGHLLYYKHRTDFSEIDRSISAIPAELHPAAWRGLGFSLAYHYRPEDEPPVRLLSELRSGDPKLRSAVIQGIDEALGEGNAWLTPRTDPENAQNLRGLLEDSKAGSR